MTRAEEPAAEPVEVRPVGAWVTYAQMFRWGFAAALGVLAVALLCLALYSIRNILVLVVIALFVAVSLDPAVRWLIRKGMRRGLAVAVIVLLVLGLGGLFVWSVAPPLVSEGTKLLDNLPGYVRTLPDRSRSLREFSDRYHLTQKAIDYAAQLPGRVASSGVAFLRRFLGAVLSTLLVIVLTLYFMTDLPRLERGLVRLFPRTRRAQVADIVQVVVDKVGAYMIGNIIISIFAGAATFIFLTVARVPYALPLALAVAITDLIPIVGATLGAAVCLLVTGVTSGLWPATVVVAIFFVIYQQVENYWIAPHVLRNTVDLPAVAVLLSALIGGTLLGLPGALMAIPVAAAIKVLMSPVIAAMHAPPEPTEAVPVAGVEPSEPAREASGTATAQEATKPAGSEARA